MPPTKPKKVLTLTHVTSTRDGAASGARFLLIVKDPLDPARELRLDFPPHAGERSEGAVDSYSFSLTDSGIDVDLLEARHVGIESLGHDAWLPSAIAVRSIVIYPDHPTASPPQFHDVVVRSWPSKRWFSTDISDPFDQNLAKPIRFLDEGAMVAGLELGDGAGSVLAPEGTQAPSFAPMITFVFRPGGVRGGNVFTDFLELRDALASVEGLKILEFDDSIVSPIELPIGTFPMHLVSWTGSAPRGGARHARVNIPEGCLLPGLRMISGPVEVECAATRTAPVADFETGARVIQIGSRLDDGAPFVYCTGTAPLFDLGGLPNDPANQCAIVVSGHWGEATDPTLTLTPLARMSTGRVIFRLRSFGSIGENMISAGPSVSVFLDWDGGIESTEQSSILGTLTIRNPGYRTRNRLVPQATAPGLAPAPSEDAIPASAMQTGDLLLLAPGASTTVVQTLPKIVGAFQSQNRPKSTLGHQLLVKNVGEGGVDVVGAPGNLIDAEPDAVRIGAGESCIFESDGVSNWYVVGFSGRPKRS